MEIPGRGDYKPDKRVLPRGRSALPLPGGEGRGEGERSTIFLPPVILAAAVLSVATFCGCHSLQHVTRSTAELLAARTNYPAYWWTPVPTNGAPAWEILPQAAGPGEVILSKRHELGLLSNFAATPFTFRGQCYASLEGFWQMMKYPEGDDAAESRSEKDFARDR